ncbi:MAG: hypothetical protein KDC26_05710 [Armatimonadetes bacterium]|nr:hypothetical protein [Armatimonadota bacterium]
MAQEMIDQRVLVQAGAASLVAAGIAAPIIYRTLLKIQSRQTVSEHVQEHAHKQGTPTMGGLIVLVGLLGGMLCTWRAEYLPYLLLLIGFGIVGFADDFIVPKLMAGKRGLGWMPKLGLEIGAVLGAFWLSGGTDWVACAAIAFIVLFFSNAYNFSDGLDTLSGGIAIWLCIGFFAIAGLIAAPSLPVQILSVMLSVAFLPFLFYNAPPAKVFMGDVGALPIGAVFGWMIVDLTGGMQWSQVTVLFAPITILSIVMLFEIIPGPLQIASVKLRKKRLFNFKTPIHHAFQEKGWPETRVVWMFHIVQAVCSLVAIGWVAWK